MINITVNHKRYNIEPSDAQVQILDNGKWLDYSDIKDQQDANDAMPLIYNNPLKFRIKISKAYLLRLNANPERYAIPGEMNTRSDELQTSIQTCTKCGETRRSNILSAICEKCSKNTFKCVACGWVGDYKNTTKATYPGQFEDEQYHTCPECGSDEIEPYRKEN